MQCNISGKKQNTQKEVPQTPTDPSQHFPQIGSLIFPTLFHPLSNCTFITTHNPQNSTASHLGSHTPPSTTQIPPQSPHKVPTIIPTHIPTTSPQTSHIHPYSTNTIDTFHTTPSQTSHTDSLLRLCVPRRATHTHTHSIFTLNKSEQASKTSSK